MLLNPYIFISNLVLILKQSKHSIWLEYWVTRLSCFCFLEVIVSFFLILYFLWLVFLPLACPSKIIISISNFLDMWLNSSGYMLVFKLESCMKCLNSFGICTLNSWSIKKSGFKVSTPMILFTFWNFHCFCQLFDLFNKLKFFIHQSLAKQEPSLCQ